MVGTMNTRAPSYLLSLITAAFFLTSTTSTFAAGGSLTPPGAPGVTMKSLEEIEPGTPINPADVSTTGISISTPGYYYLTGNIENVAATSSVFLITASNVTLDLRGFSLIADGATGTAAASSAIYGSGNLQHNIVVRNGNIKGAWYAGVHLLGKSNARCDNIRVYQTASYGLVMGVSSHITNCQINGKNTSIDTAGITSSNGSIIKNCSVTLCLGDGFAPAGNRSSILECTAIENGGIGFDLGDSYILKNCTSAQNGGGGYNTGVNNTVSHCTAYLNTGDGFVVGQGSIVTNSTSRSNTQDGFDFASDCKVHVCVAVKNDAEGFNFETGCHISECIAAENDSNGFRALTSNSFTECTSRDNGQASMGALADGFDLGNLNRIRNCKAYNNYANGISVTSTLNDIRDNHIHNNGSNGINLSSSSNLVTGNYVSSNGGSNINPAPSIAGDIGPLESGYSGTSPNANFE